MKKVYIIISAYNEEQNIPALYDGLSYSLSEIRFWDYELVFVNDGSKDGSLNVLFLLQENDSKITIINQSKNFGHEMAMTAGMNYVAQYNTETDYAVLFMDADLQHPPEMAAEIIQKWLQGHKLILTQPTDNEGKGIRYKILGNMCYKILNFLSDVKIPRNMSDFRLLDKKYLVWINQLNETDRMFRGMLSLVGFQDALILKLRAPKRFAGKSKYNFFKLYKLAIDSVIQFSVKPLRIATFLGFLGCFASLLFLLFSIYESHIHHEPKTGFLTLLSIMIFFCSLIMLFLDILEKYIGRIHIEVKNRPLYFNKIIKQKR